MQLLERKGFSAAGIWLKGKPSKTTQRKLSGSLRFEYKALSGRRKNKHSLNVKGESFNSEKPESK